MTTTKESSVVQSCRLSTRETILPTYASGPSGLECPCHVLGWIPRFCWVVVLVSSTFGFAFGLPRRLGLLPQYFCWFPPLLDDARRILVVEIFKKGLTLMMSSSTSLPCRNLLSVILTRSPQKKIGLLQIPLVRSPPRGTTAELRQ